jgi:ElaB/YqjD/DUF883 family membrane-anchored ribosome-binding protein
MTSEVSDLAVDTLAEVGAAAQDQYDQLVAMIRRNPFQSAAVAAGIGFVAALVARGSFPGKAH